MCHASSPCSIKWQLCAESLLPGDHRHSYLRQHSLRRMREYLDCLDTWDQSCIKDSANPTVHSCWAGGISCLLSEPGYKVQVRMEQNSVSCLFSYCGTASQRKTQNALCIFCNSLIRAAAYFFGVCFWKHTYTNFIRLDCSVDTAFWTKPKSLRCMLMCGFPTEQFWAPVAECPQANKTTAVMFVWEISLNPEAKVL